MNKRGLFGLIGIIIIIILVAGSGYVYFKFLGNGVQVGTGKVALDITLSKDQTQETPEESEKNETQNDTIESITVGGSDTPTKSDPSSPPGHPSAFNTLAPEQ